MKGDRLGVRSMAAGRPRLLAGGTNGELLPTIDTGLVVVRLIALVAMVAMVAGLVWWAWQRIRASRMVTTGLLTTQAVVLPEGPRRDIAVLRRDVSRGLEQARRAVAALPRTGSVRNELADLVPRLDVASASLDEQLHLLQTEPDPVFLYVALPPLERRAKNLTLDATRLRHAALHLLIEQRRSERELLEKDLRDSLVGLEAGLADLHRVYHRKAHPLVP